MTKMCKFPGCFSWTKHWPLWGRKEKTHLLLQGNWKKGEESKAWVWPKRSYVYDLSWGQIHQPNRCNYTSNANITSLIAKKRPNKGKNHWGRPRTSRAARLILFCIENSRYFLYASLAQSPHTWMSSPGTPDWKAHDAPPLRKEWPVNAVASGMPAETMSWRKTSMKMLLVNHLTWALWR